MLARKAVIRAWDAANYLADVRIVGSLAIDLAGVPVSRAIAGAEMVVGRTVVLVQFDPTNHKDAVIIAVVA